MSHAKAGVTLAAYLKVLSFAFFIIPGMISRVLYPGQSLHVVTSLQCFAAPPLHQLNSTDSAIHYKNTHVANTCTFGTHVFNMLNSP